jgi:hypothetical protein
MHACTHVLSRGFAKRVTAPRSVVLGRGGSTAPPRETIQHSGSRCRG